ncbi:hypothetical protein [Paenibacillus apiarius]|uniref:hypothetical protein n=1 Tax=Paenibacillus apiarius TaxID=46240 RepID=UPI003B3A5C6D
MIDSNYGLLSQHYPISRVLLIEKMGQGMTSEARLVVTTEGRYILRKLRDEEQGTTEYNIYKRLEPYKITPEIVLSKQEAPYIRLDDGCYNLQRYIESHPRQSSTDFYQLGQTVSLFHYAMRDTRHIIGQKDRFCLESMWDDVKELKNGFEIIQAIQHPVERAISYCHEMRGFIHADLGAWNILIGSTGVYMWMVRGMVAIVKQFGMNERTRQYCNASMKRLHQIDDIIKQA